MFPEIQNSIGSPSKPHFMIQTRKLNIISIPDLTVIIDAIFGQNKKWKSQKWPAWQLDNQNWSQSSLALH